MADVPGYTINGKVCSVCKDRTRLYHARWVVGYVKHTPISGMVMSAGYLVKAAIILVQWHKDRVWLRPPLAQVDTRGIRNPARVPSS